MMERRSNSPPESVGDQAAEWFIRLRDRDLTAVERRQYMRWLKQSPSHIGEFMRICQMYGRVKRAKVPARPPAGADASNVVALPRPADPRSPEGRRYEPLTFRLAAAACAVALVCVIGLVAKLAYFDNRIETQLSEWRKFQLADGSVVIAGPRTLLHVDYSDKWRRVRLQRGEAKFTVAKDPSRPFLVNADAAVVRAIGTKFGVDRRDGTVVVVVAEGKVAVARGTQGASLENALAQIDQHVAVSLVQDERVEISADAPTLPLQVEKVDAARALAWAEGQLIFQKAQNATVADAVRELNRRNRVQIEVDPAIAAAHICCSFDAANPVEFAETVAKNPGVVLVRDPPNVLRLVPEPDAAQ